MHLRSLVLFLVVIFLVSGCNIVNTIRMRNANDHLIPEWPVGETQVDLVADYEGEKPYVKVAINGVNGFRFLIDTGASVTYIIDTPKVKALNLEAGFSLSVSGWGDEQDSPAYQTEVETLSLNGIRFEEVNLSFLPVTTSRYFLRADEAVFDGVLGNDILRHFSWKFDKLNQAISISKEAYLPSGSEYSFEFETFFSKIELEAEIDFGSDQKVSADLIIDTGSRHYLKVSTALVDSHEVSLPKPSITAADFGLSGRTIHQRVTLPGINFPKLKIEKIKTNLIGGDFDDDFAVIGSALLNQFVSVIDYHAEKLYLTKYPESNFRTRYNLLGLELRKIRSGDFVVRYVFPDLVAHDYDLKVGDIITSINSDLSVNLSQDDWLELSATPNQYKICRIREIEKCMVLTSKYLTGYSEP